MDWKRERREFIMERGGKVEEVDGRIEGEDWGRRFIEIDKERQKRKS